MKNFLSRSNAIRTAALAVTVFFLAACSPETISEEEAVEINDQIEDIRSRLSQIEGSLGDIVPAEGEVPEEKVASVRDELEGLRQSLADIQEAIEPPEPEQPAAPQQPVDPQQPGGTGTPGAPGTPASPAQPGE